MKLAEKLVALHEDKLVDTVITDVKSTFFKDEMDDFKNFDAFFKEVDSQMSFNKKWDADKMKPVYKQVFDKIKKGEVKLGESK